MRFLPYKNDFHNAITYEMSDINQIYYRDVYGILDWLRDIGGLYGAIGGISLAAVLIFQFQGPVIFTMTDMFSVPKGLGLKGQDLTDADRRR